MQIASSFGKFLLALALWVSAVLCYSFQTNAQPLQVQRANGPFSGKAKSLILHNRQLFAVITDADSYTLSTQADTKTIVQSGIYRSADNGTSWSAVSSFPVPTLAASLFSHQNVLYALTSALGLQLYRSPNDGASWEAVPTGMLTAVTHLVALGDTVFARTGLETRISTMVMSADSGKTWSLVSSPGSIGSIVASRSLLFGGSPNGLLRSSDRGLSWPIVPTTPPITNVILYDIAAKANDDLVLATNQGVLSSSDNGQTWRSLNTGLEGKTVRSLTAKGDTLFAAANDGFYFNAGGSWQKILINRTIPTLEAFAIISPETEKRLYIGTQSGVFRTEFIASVLTATTWVQMNRGLPGVRLEQGALASAGSVFLASSQTYGIFRAVDGSTWMPSNIGLPNNTATLHMAASQTSSVAIASTKNSLFVSADAGASWKAASIGIGSNEITALGSASSVGISTERLLVGTLSGSIFRANDISAQSWSRTLANPLEGSDVRINAFMQSSTTAFCATNEGLLSSNDGASSWKRLQASEFPRVPTWSLASAPGLLLAGTNDGVYRSFDEGRSWQAPQTNASIGVVVSLVAKNGLLYAGTETDGVYRSIDNGSSWQKLALAGISAVKAMIADSTRLIVGTPNGVYEYLLPSPLEFPRVTALQPSDSALVGLADVVLTIVGANFSSTATVAIAGQTLVPQSVTSTRIVVKIPVSLLQSVGTITLEVVNSPTARASTALRVVPIPQNFPRLSVTTTLETFTAFITQISPTQKYTLSGTNVRDSVVIQAPQGFELSADTGRTWLSSGRLVLTTTASPTFARDIIVRFRPLLSQSVSGFITHSVGGIVLQSLAVVGNPKSLQLEISPNGVLTYGATHIGRTLKQSISLVNTNPISITVATIITGTNAAEFTASVQQIVIPPLGGRATVDITFAPQARGDREASITFSGLASGQVSLRGRGVQSVFTVSAPEIVFSTSAFVGQTVKLPAETFGIRNDGDIEDVITGVRITSETSSGVAFRMRNFAPVRLEVGASTTLAVEFTPDSEGISRATLTLQTQEPSTSSAIVRLRGQGQILAPPMVVFPRSGGTVLGSAVALQWQAAPQATHYEVALDEASNSKLLLGRIAASTSLTQATVAIMPNKTYYWTVRSLAVSGVDTLVRSAWQQWQFFSTASESRISMPPVLDIGVITQEQNESPPRGQPISVVSGSWRILDVGIVQEDDLANSDFRAFRILNRESLLSSGAVLRPSQESYTIAAAFRPPQPRSRPYSAIAELRVQNVATGEVLILPFQLLARAAQCPQIGTGSIGNQGCPETMLRLQILPSKAVFAPGDEIRLQIQLVQIANFSPNLDRFMRQLRLTLDVQNITLLSFPDRLSAGSAVPGDTSVRMVSFAAASLPAASSVSLDNTDGKIRLDLLRPTNALQNVVLGELTGKAVVGLRGLGASPEESVTAASITIANAQWLSDTREALDSGQVIMWGDVRGVPITLQRVSVTVNTCQTTQGSLLLTATLPLNIKSLAPNPVQDETTITFTLQERGWTEMELINGFGQSVKKFFSSEMLPGEYTVRCSVTDLPSGSYFLLLRTPFETVQQRMGVIR